MGISAKLKKWQENDLISAEQREKILAFENKSSRNWVGVILNCLAGFLIGMGIISLVAFNWEKIPDCVKLAVMFLLLGINAFGIIKVNQKNKNIATQVLSVIMALMIGASIGLIGQVYNLRSDIAIGICYWGFLTLPLLYFAPRIFYFWFPAVLTALMDKYLQNDEIFIIIFVVTLLYEIFKTLVKSKNNIFVNVLKIYSGVALLFAFCDVDFNLHFFNNTSAIFVQKMSGVFSLSAIALFMLNSKMGKMSFMPFFWLALVFVINVQIILLPTILFAVILGIYAYYYKLPKLFNVAVIIVVLRLFIAYCEVSNLLYAGLNFILGGIVLLLVLRGLHKYGAKMWEKLNEK